MTERPYENEASQRERKAVLKNDTYLARAQATVGEELGGRFQKLAKTTVTGVPTVPKQPATSPWAEPDPNVEPAFGVDINYVEPIGTRAEQASIAGTPPTVPELPSAVDPGGVPAPSLRRRA